MGGGIGETGGGNIWIDISGCAHLFGGEVALLQDLRTRLSDTGFSHRIALADTPGAAWAVARFAINNTQTHAPSLIVPSEETAGKSAIRAALGPLPVAALRLPAATLTGLSALGLRTIETLMTSPRGPLAARFGRHVADQLDKALGVLFEPISPRAAPPENEVRRAFAEPIGQAGDIAAALEHMLAGLCRALTRRGYGARRVQLVLYHTDRRVSRIVIGTGRPNRDPAHLMRLFAEQLDSIDPGFGIEIMALAATAADPLGAYQQDLSADGTEHSPQRETGKKRTRTAAHNLDTLIDRLSNRLGAVNVRRPVTRESYLPERAVRAIPAMEMPFGRDGRHEAARQMPEVARPLRLLRRAERIEAMTPPPAAEHDDPPVLFRWRHVLHHVTHAEGPERIAPEWWRDRQYTLAGQEAKDDPKDTSQETSATDETMPVGWGLAPRTRDYYRVEDADGQRFWLYREGLCSSPSPPDQTPVWYLHGIFA